MVWTLPTYLRVYRTPHEVLSWRSFWAPKMKTKTRNHEGPVSRPENGHGFRAQKTVTLRSGKTRGPPVVTKSAPIFWPRNRVPGTPQKNDPDETKKRRRKNKKRRVDLDHDLDQMMTPPPCILRGGSEGLMLPPAAGHRGKTGQPG